MVAAPKRYDPMAEFTSWTVVCRRDRMKRSLLLMLLLLMDEDDEDRSSRSCDGRNESSVMYAHANRKAFQILLLTTQQQHSIKSC